MRMNISVPDELAARVRELKVPVSAICQQALRAEAGKSADPDGSPGITRDGAADWTADPETGRSNTSAEYRRLAGEVEELIRSQAHALISGRAGQVAGLIVARLAHVHHLAPARPDDIVTP